MRRFASTFVLIVACSNANALGLTIQFDNHSAPFELNCEGLESPMEFVVKVYNDLENDVSVLAWQLDLRIVAQEDTFGSLQFDSIGPAPEPLFGEASAPGCDPSSSPPGDSMFCQDMDDEMGEMVPTLESREILGVTISASPDASGAFDVLMRSTDPNADSSWFDNGFNAWAFANSAPSSLPGYFRLGTIHIEPPSSPVDDYDGDGDFDEQDYEAWRESFGMQVESPGDGADGNNNGVVDLPDYVIWRMHFVGTLSGVGQGQNALMPEPSTAAPVAVGLLAVFAMRMKKRSIHMHAAAVCGRRHDRREKGSSVLPAVDSPR